MGGEQAANVLLTVRQDQLEATGKKPPPFKASYASLTKDPLLEPYLTSANKAVPLEDELTSTVDRWTLVGFSPSSI